MSKTEEHSVCNWHDGITGGIHWVPSKLSIEKFQCPLVNGFINRLMIDRVDVLRYSIIDSMVTSASMNPICAG